MGHKNRRFLPVWVGLASCLSTLLILACSSAEKEQEQERAPVVEAETLKSRLVLQTEEDPEKGTKISRGGFLSFEDRESQSGRMIRLDVVVLHALDPNAKPDPVFYLAGGPGQDVTQSERALRSYWIRQERDIVLVSQRGTGGDNKISCDAIADDDNIQVYLDPLFTVDVFRACYEILKKTYDLTK